MDKKCKYCEHWLRSTDILENRERKCPYFPLYLCGEEATYDCRQYVHIYKFRMVRYADIRQRPPREKLPKGVHIKKDFAEKS